MSPDDSHDESQEQSPDVSPDETHDESPDQSQLLVTTVNLIKFKKQCRREAKSLVTLPIQCMLIVCVLKVCMNTRSMGHMVPTCHVI